MYANYAVYLCGHVLDLFADRAASQNRESDLYINRWTELFESIEDWYQQRPEEMRPILHLQADETDLARPFPVILFSNAPAGELNRTICVGHTIIR